MAELKSISIDGTSYNVDLPAITAGLKAMLLDALYPVGSIYMSTDSTDPGSTLGGTWTQIKDTFLLACGIKYMGGVLVEEKLLPCLLRLVHQVEPHPRLHTKRKDHLAG